MKTKNFYGWLAMAAMLVGTGCSTDEVVNDFSPKNAIQFGTYVGRDAESRATVIDATKLGTDGFGVFAYYTDNGDYVSGDDTQTNDVEVGSLCNFMYNQVVNSSDNGTTWTYSPMKYWPNDNNDKLTFFAYAPHDDDDATANTNGYDNISFNSLDNMKGDPVITFRVNNTVVNQTDLLISKTKNVNKVKNPSSGTGIKVEDKISFHFAHALARIGFTVKAITDEVTATDKQLDKNTTIVLKKVVLAGNAGEGNDAPTGKIFYTQGSVNLNGQPDDFNQSDATHSDKANSTTYTQVIWQDIVGDADDSSNPNAVQQFVLENSNFAEQTAPTASTQNTDADWTATTHFATFNSEGFVITGGANGNSTNANPLNADNSYIMIIPQDLSTSGFYVYVEYDVITLDKNLGYTTSTTTYNEFKSKVTNHISTKVEGINFESGKAYKLNLQLGMTSVKLTASVDAWSEGNDQNKEVDLPINTTTSQQNP